MRTIKRLIAVLLVAALLFSLAGCTVINPQRMYRVKGTYKLTQYTFSPQGEEGSASTVDYVLDGDRLYEDYLIVTGEGTGYYVHKSVGADATVTELSLSYQYAEDGKKIGHVSYGNTDMENPHSGISLGVSRNTLAFSQTAIHYVEPFTGRQMSTKGVSVRFERVSRKTDLSYVESVLGALPDPITE